MTLVKFNPERRMRRMHRFGNPFFPFYVQPKSEVNAKRNFMPNVDVHETDDMIMMSVELPGFKSDAVKISIDKDRILSIKGERKNERSEENGKQWRNEIFYGEFERRFTLPDDINDDAIDARFENGILELKLPKVKPQKPQEIEVTIH